MGSAQTTMDRVVKKKVNGDEGRREGAIYMWEEDWGVGLVLPTT